jgi:ubiquinone/menaquinone biosynthesis C-methylase UbiE
MAELGEATEKERASPKQAVLQARFYNRFAQMYDSMEEGSEESGNSLARNRFLTRKKSLILKALSLGKHDTVIDVGCGTALLASAAARRGATVVAVDVSGEMLKIAKKKHADCEGNLEYVQGDALRLPIATGRIDKYMSSNLLEHLPSTEEHFLEVRRILDAKGIACFNFPNGSTKLATLERLINDAFRRILSRKEKHRTYFKTIADTMSLAWEESNPGTEGRFEHNELDFQEVMKLLDSNGFRSVSMRSFGAIPSCTPDPLMRSGLPGAFEEIVEQSDTLRGHLGSILVIARK